jgi:hypothetical protein
MLKIIENIDKVLYFAAVVAENKKSICFMIAKTIKNRKKYKV